jgi:hypothetical protein
VDSDDGPCLVLVRPGRPIRCGGTKEVRGGGRWGSRELRKRARVGTCRGIPGDPPPLASGSSSRSRDSMPPHPARARSICPRTAPHPPPSSLCCGVACALPPPPAPLSVGCVPFFFYPGPSYLLPCCVLARLLTGGAS